jgi:signal transduction histidine kinase
VGLIREGNQLRFYVKDQGQGIAKENLVRIFNRFERAVPPNEVSGLGLGLYISKQIIESHHGRIWAESELGSGSTFWLELPLYE